MKLTKAEPIRPPVQAGDLHICLYDRSLHPELFRHYATFRVGQSKYYADVSIIGLGHLVTVTAGPKVATELLWHDTEVLPTRGVLKRFRLKGERDDERCGPESWQYMVSSQLEQMDEALYKSVHNDLQRHGSKRGWFVAYDQWADGDMVPFSYIDHEARDSEFHVHAFHAFPHERTIVKTQTILELVT